VCRWLAYFGDPIRPEELLYEPRRSLIEQSRRGVQPDAAIANADGFGLGWYGLHDTPGLYRSSSPAWGDQNLRDLSAQIRTPLFLSHVRAASGGVPVQQTNCHPFRYRRWLFVHNGFIEEWPRLRRELTYAVDPALYPCIEGSTDSETMFYLALTFGLEDDPVGGLERMAGFVEQVGRRAGVEYPLQMTVGLSDGERVYAARYASRPPVNTLFVSTSVQDIRLLMPAEERFKHFSDEARVVVSEPLIDLPGLWHEIPPSTALIVQDGPDLDMPFRPSPP
jgi:predicted glutamine amidotransferase